MTVQVEVPHDRGKLFRMDTGRVYEVVTEFGWILHAATGAVVDHPESDEVMRAVLKWRGRNPESAR